MNGDVSILIGGLNRAKRKMTEAQAALATTQDMCDGHDDNVSPLFVTLDEMHDAVRSLKDAIADLIHEARRYRDAAWSLQYPEDSADCDPVDL